MKKKGKADVLTRVADADAVPTGTKQSKKNKNPQEKKTKRSGSKDTKGEGETTQTAK